MDHMKAHWDEIGFKPSEFQLKLDETNENLTDTADAIIKTNNSFTPPPKQTSNLTTEGDSNNANKLVTGVVIKNLPENIPEVDAIHFLKSHGLEDKG